MLCQHRDRGERRSGGYGGAAWKAGVAREATDADAPRPDAGAGPGIPVAKLDAEHYQ